MAVPCPSTPSTFLLEFGFWKQICFHACTRRCCSIHHFPVLPVFYPVRRKAALQHPHTAGHPDLPPAAPRHLRQWGRQDPYIGQVPAIPAKHAALHHRCAVACLWCFVVLEGAVDGALYPQSNYCSRLFLRYLLFSCLPLVVFAVQSKKRLSRSWPSWLPTASMRPEMIRSARSSSKVSKPPTLEIRTHTSSTAWSTTLVGTLRTNFLYLPHLSSCA